MNQIFDFKALMADAIDVCDTILSKLREDEPDFTYVERGSTCFWIYLNGEKLTSFAAVPTGEETGMEFMTCVPTDLDTDDDGIIRFNTYEEVLEAVGRLIPLTQT